MNEQTPYLDDDARKAATHGRAIFGDKEKDLLDGLTVTSQGQDQLAHVESAQVAHDEQLERGLGLTAAQMLALEDKATRENWDQARIEKAELAMSVSSSKEQ